MVFKRSKETEKTKKEQAAAKVRFQAKRQIERVLAQWGTGRVFSDPDDHARQAIEMLDEIEQVVKEMKAEKNRRMQKKEAEKDDKPWLPD
jgi:hypothetical protein